uniref:Ig-like domain-containing protein n=1 Tax=Otus sunia TaxID=257818 RepID=A0A8C8ACI9_9STRI
MVVSLDVLPLALLEQAAGLATAENEDIKIDFQVTEMPPRFAQEVEGEKCVNISFDVFAEPSREERVEFRAEDSESCSFEFHVTEAPPKFLRLISDYSTFVGASACFSCLVTGSPHPSIHWYKDGVLLEGDRYCAQEEQGGSHSLTIEDLMQSDSGQYKCIATNRAGTAETCAVVCFETLNVSMLFSAGKNTALILGALFFVPLGMKTTLYGHISVSLKLAFVGEFKEHNKSMM